MATATAPQGHCVCSHPDCRAHQENNCTAPGTKPVSIKYKGERMGEYRFCEPCRDGWKKLEEIEVNDVVPVVS